MWPQATPFDRLPKNPCPAPHLLVSLPRATEVARKLGQEPGPDPLESNTRCYVAGLGRFPDTVSRSSAQGPTTSTGVREEPACWAELFGARAHSIG